MNVIFVTDPGYPKETVTAMAIRMIVPAYVEEMLRKMNVVSVMGMVLPAPFTTLMYYSIAIPILPVFNFM